MKLFKFFIIIFTFWIFTSLLFTESLIVNGTNKRPVQLAIPKSDRPLSSFIQNGLIHMIFGMENANFSKGNVLFTEFLQEDSFKQPLPLIRSNTSTSLNLSQFKKTLDDYLISNKPISITNKSLLNNLQLELNRVDSLEITHFKRVSVTKVVSIKTHFVVILWDNDSSVVNTIDLIQNNKSLSQQPFSGDEIFTVVQQKITNERFFGTFWEGSNWQYNNGKNATFFKQLINELGKNPGLTPTLSQQFDLKTNFNLLRTLTSNDRSLIDVKEYQARNNVHLGFSISQVQINDLDLVRNLKNQVSISNLNFAYIEHQSLGWTIFNDTNQNGIMDLGLTTIRNQNPALNSSIVPIRSDESLYRIDFRNIGKVVMTPTTKTLNDLSFGLIASDIGVILNPISKDREATLFSDDFSIAGMQTITNLGFNFHFTPDETTGRAIIKFDMEIGDWSNKLILNGLSLNHLMITSVKNFNPENQTFQLYSNQTAINSEKDAASHRNFTFKSENILLGKIELDSQPYNWSSNSTSINAFGQSLPLLYGKLLLGSLTSEATVYDIMRQQQGAESYLYSLSYPIFSGETIKHDPVYSMYLPEILPISSITNVYNLLATKSSLTLLTTFLTIITLGAYFIIKRQT